ncbi:MAG: hypothetical protein NTY35_13165 [Planctomycetota bacterium]|nr:hypothetical protein [Planctomycetota bacterium]
MRGPSRFGRNLKVFLACVALLAAGALVALQVRRAIAADTGSWVSGDVRASAFASARRVVWRAPEPFASGIAGEGVTTRVAWSPDGQSAVVAHGERGQDATLWLVEMEGERVASERPLLELDAPGDEVAPWYDGSTLWFASDRPGGRGGLDLWSARRSGREFEAAQWLGADVNSSADDTDPTVHGTELVFASDRAGSLGGLDLWTASLDGGRARSLPGLCTATDEREPAFAPDGGSLWFSAGTEGAHDLVRAFRAGDRWFARESPDGLSTGEDERAPCPLGSGFELGFLRGTTAANLWRARSVELHFVPPPPWTLAEILLLVSLTALATLAWFARDVSRFDTLVAAWAASIVVHGLVLLLLGEVRLREPAPRGNDDAGEPLQLRVVASSRSASRAGGSDGGGGRLLRADIGREVGESELAASADLSAELAAPAEGAPVPGRGAMDATFAAGPRPVEDVPRERIQAAPLVDARRALPAAGPSVRAGGARATESTLERLAYEPAPDASRESRLVTAGLPLSLDPVLTSAPVVARAVSVPSSAVDGPRSLEDRERAATPPAVAKDPRRGDPEGPADALAALAPAAGSRRAAEPLLERFEFDGPGRGAAPTPTEVAPTLASLADEIPIPVEQAVPGASLPRTAATPYQSRSGPAKQRALEENGGTRETEAAVRNGLAYLARIQGRLGQWGPLEVRDEKYGEICVGKTALATLAFLAAGHTHVSGTEYSRNVQRALAFLLAVQDPASGHFGDTSAYSHGIATFALAEALATTNDESLRDGVERGVRHMLERQSRDPDPRKLGGWSYYYADPDRTFDPWPRTSITAWQVLALESARLSGVTVPDSAFDQAARFLEGARGGGAPWYRYSHEPERLRSAYPTLPASTPAALFALSCVGRDITGPEHAGARQYVLDRAPRGYRFTNERDFVERGQGNPYFWYQGTLAMMRVGGTAWRRWNVALQETLLPAQEADGSWRPIDVYAQYARDDERDRSYTTALCVLCLEVYYRYDLPLLRADRAPRTPTATREAASPR